MLVSKPTLTSGCTIMILQANVKAWIGTHVIAHDQEIQKCVFCRQINVDALSGL